MFKTSCQYKGLSENLDVLLQCWHIEGWARKLYRRGSFSVSSWTHLEAILSTLNFLDLLSWALRELPNCCCLLSGWLFSVICGHLKYILQLKLNSGASIPFSIPQPLQLETKLNSSAAPLIEPAIEVYNLYPSLIKLKSANKCEMNGNASIMYANVFFWTRLLLLV